MSKAILSLYDYMLINQKLVDKIKNVNENDFYKNEILINAGYGIVSNIMNGLLAMDERILACNDYILNKSKELFAINKYINKNDCINGYFVYDFLKVEYNSLLKEINKLLKI